jgi:tRNA A-37 threonylcarbamoyl transferase component Bud32
MNDSRQCPECKTPVSESGPSAGLCPRCLIRQGLTSRSSTRTGGGGPGHFEPPDPEELGKRFPQFEILELVGHGGMGAVYKARQPALDRLVALKILAPDRVRDPAFAERFSREARTLARLSHPHIVGIYDVGEADSLYYFIMEYVDGANLREVMQAGQLSPGDALTLVPQLCDALQFAHEAGVVHRDIKPENILLDRSGQVKIADFGLAKLLEPDRVDGVSLTVSGAVMGTPAYMAPEQIEHPLEVDHRADIYAVGVVLYEMLTGELPLGRFDPPSSMVRVDVRLDQVVLRALEKEPARRYQLANDVKTDLEQLGSVEAAPAPAAAPAAGTRTVTITRPAIVNWIAAYSFFMAAALPASIAVWLLLSTGRLGGAGSWRIGLATMAFGTIAGAIALALALWHGISGLGAVRLRNWARYSLIILAVLEVPWVVLAVLRGGLVVLLPVTIASVLILIYLLRQPVAQIFALGLGPATVPAAEADALERVIRR